MRTGSAPPPGGGSSAALATSSHPVPAHAVAECAGQLIDLRGPAATDVLVAVPPACAGALEDIVSALGSLLAARTVAGVVTGQVWTGATGGAEGSAMAVLSFAAVDPALVPLGAGRGRRESAQRPRGLLISLPGRSDAAAPAGLEGVAAELTPVATSEQLRVHLDGAAVAAEAILVVPPVGAPEPLPAQGVVRVAGEMEVTSSDGDAVVALDSRPAADAFEAALAAADSIPADADLVGFVGPTGPPLIAARRSSEGLALSRPVGVGTALSPAVRSPSALLSEVSEAAGAGAPEPTDAPVSLVLGDDRSAPRSLPVGLPAALAGVRWAGLQVRGLRVSGSQSPSEPTTPAAAVTLRIPGS